MNKNYIPIGTNAGASPTLTVGMANNHITHALNSLQQYTNILNAATASTMSYSATSGQAVPIKELEINGGFSIVRDSYGRANLILTACGEEKKIDLGYTADKNIFEVLSDGIIKGLSQICFEAGARLENLKAFK